MSSSDGSDEQEAIDRMATHVYDPEPSEPSTPRNAVPPGVPDANEPVAGPDDPTPPPTASGAYEQVLGADDPTPPPTTSGAYEQVLGADDPTPPPTSATPPPAHDTSAGRGRSAHDAEHLSDIGYIPGSNFKAPDAAKSKKRRSDSPRQANGRTVTVAGRTFNLPSLRWLDDADTLRRAQYGGMGLIAGALMGGVLGVLNAFLQGWSIAQGSGQLLALAAIFGVICAVMAAMRPNRVDRIFEKFGIDN